MTMSAVRQEAFDQGAVTLVIMAEIDHPEGFGYFWSGLGDLDHDGNVYRGFGSLVSISAVQSSTDVEVVEVRFVLSGVDADLLAGLDDSVKGRSAHLYEALLDDNYRVIERTLLVESTLDYQVYAVGADGKATIALVAHAGMYQLLNRSGAKWSPQEARAIYPDETGFDEIHLQEDQPETWRAA